MNEQATGYRSLLGGCAAGLALLLMAAAWLALAPWRPVLAGDDFGYYESVVRTLTEGRVVISDWLNPFAVGMTVPATGLVNLTGDLWLGGMLTVGAFGLAGLWAFGRLLSHFGQPPALVACGMMAWAFFPAWLVKWTHFESAVPATSLMLLALLFYFRAGRDSGRPALLDLLAGGAFAAWAVAVRQNHLVLVLVGAAGLMADSRSGKLLRLMGWSLFPVIVFLFLQYGMPKTFAQERVLGWHLSQLNPGEYAGRLFRGTFFSFGGALGLLLLSNPGDILARLRQPAAWRRWLGVTSLLALLVPAFLSGMPARWLAPHSDALYLERFPWLLAVVTGVGALSWPFCLPTRCGRISSGLLAAAAGYIALASFWGYWEYYFLEVTLLIWLSVVNPRPIAVPGRSDWSRRAIQVVVLACYAGVSWYGQKVLTDLQSAQVEIVEQCFRDGLVRPAECRGAPFGLLGWNLFPQQVATWPATRAGGPLAFWEGRKVTACFGWHDHPDCGGEEASSVMRHGTIQVGFRQMAWSLVRLDVPEPTPTDGVGHRLLPLNRQEWRDYRLREAPQSMTVTGSDED